MIDNALYGFTRIPKSDDHGNTLHVFEDGEPVDPGKPSFLGMPKVEYLGHKVSHNGLKANPKDRHAVLESLNYYSRFIEEYAILASVLYELREIDFAAMMKDTTQARIQRVLEVESVDQGPQEDQATDPKRLWIWKRKMDPRWIHAYRSFSVLKSKIASTPILRHFDPDRRATVVVYASAWAISGSLMQEYDKLYYPVMFASRTLKLNGLNYGIAEKEMLALLRSLDLNYNALVGRPIHVLTRHSTLAWLFRSIALQGRLGQWNALLSRNIGGERIAPRSQVDKALISIVPKKEPRRKIQAPTPTIGRDEDPYTVSFDGSARVKRCGGAYSAILWKMPEWRVLKGTFGSAEGLTVSEAEYHGLLLCLDLLEDLDLCRLVICGESNLVIRQVRGEIDCKTPGRTLLRQRVPDRLRNWPDHELLHVKRDWNGSADSIPSPALERQCGIDVESEREIQDLVTLNRLDEILVARIRDEVTQISAVTTQSKARSGVRAGSDPGSLRDEVMRELRIERTPQEQDEESWISGLKKYLIGETQDLTQEDAKSDLFFYCPATKGAAADVDKLMRLEVPETLQQAILHHYHTSLQGGYQGIGRTYGRIRDHFQWRGLYKSV
ncbi:reverse transcriptase [Phytophthora megakarya]|uniref:Reverse transcriptase n=1 Tax=Phytophthora megakarya TaxID=4795 RepID=A0A225VR64_9STRA|nr:reverse transcriptase [Phytophthora megakarya]